jgi:hypothetical protein
MMTSHIVFFSKAFPHVYATRSKSLGSIAGRLMIDGTRLFRRTSRQASEIRFTTADDAEMRVSRGPDRMKSSNVARLYMESIAMSVLFPGVRGAIRVVFGAGSLLGILLGHLQASWEGMKL